jgi:quercetin dioxygenase-like cupin family protein
MNEADMRKSMWRPAVEVGAWKDVQVLPYKPISSAVSKSVTRQILFDEPDLACQLRYFDIQAGGYSTLERHEHLHGVMVLRGAGRCLVGEEIFSLGPYDLVTVPAMTWHQFQAAPAEPMGFLCLVNTDRDRPTLPTPEELRALRRDPRIAAFIKP